MVPTTDPSNVTVTHALVENIDITLLLVYSTIICSFDDTMTSTVALAVKLKVIPVRPRTPSDGCVMLYFANYKYIRSYMIITSYSDVGIGFTTLTICKETANVISAA